MKSKTYYSKSNPDIEYIEKKDNLKQITLDLMTILQRLKKLIKIKE